MCFLTETEEDVAQDEYEEAAEQGWCTCPDHYMRLKYLKSVSDVAYLFAAEEEQIQDEPTGKQCLLT